MNSGSFRLSLVVLGFFLLSPAGAEERSSAEAPGGESLQRAPAPITDSHLNPSPTAVKVNASEMTVRSSTAVVVSPRDIPTIQLQEAKRIFDEKRAYFVDGRSEAAFQTRHIRGALNCRLGDFEQDIVSFRKKVPLNALVVVYCSSESCGIARRVATKLVDSGYTNIRIYAGGWAEWAKAGYPAEP